MPRKFYESMRYAVRGVRFSFRTQRNMWIHAFIAVLALFLSVALQISLIEMAIMFLVIALVIVLELVNTAIEEVVNMIHLTRKMRAMFAKDVSAAAVLVTVIMSVVIGGMIFIPRIAALFFKI